MLAFKEENDFRAGAYFIIDKPLKWTSFDVVNKLKFAILHQFKGEFRKIKIGHAGTLDPLATGIVIICTGKYTKRIEEFQGQEKEYIADIKLGATTPCFDAEQPEDATYPTEHITRELVEENLQQFVGKIQQKPPLFSAIRIKGKRAYDIARKGETAEVKPREVAIKELELLDFSPTAIRLRVVCGKGTYIRSLARDLGEALGSGGYLTGLIRTRVGAFTLENASSVDESLDTIRKI